jgi:phage terminase large subunit
MTVSTNNINIAKSYRPLTQNFRYKILFGGRGAGRSWTIARLLLLSSITKKERILCTRELQKSIKQSVHRLLKDQIHLLGWESFFTITDTSIRGKNGSEFIFLGTRTNIDEIRSLEGVSKCWIEEGSSFTEESFDVLDPTIRTKGSEIWCSFNTRYKFDYIYQKFVLNRPPKNSLVIQTNFRDNPYLPEVLLLQMEELKEDDYEKYLHIWEGGLKVLSEGAIYGKQLTEAKKSNRILKEFPIASNEVFTFWDLGKNNQTSIWFMQKVGLEFRFIDYYEARLQEIPHYCRVIKGTAPTDNDEHCPIKKESNERRAKYNYGAHYMPHDISTDALGMRKPRKAQFEEGGVRPIIRVAQTRSVQEAIEQTREIMSQCYFHEKNCERGLDALSNYRYKFSEEDNTYRQVPHHDWASNGADSFRQFAQGFKPASETKDYRGKPTDYRGRFRAESSWMK